MVKVFNIFVHNNVILNEKMFFTLCLLKISVNNVLFRYVKSLEIEPIFKFRIPSMFFILVKLNKEYKFNQKTFSKTINIFDSLEICKFQYKTENEENYIFARIAARLLVTAWNPDLILATEQRDPHDSHCKKNSRVSFCRIVSGERQV